jgi:hypothetical protein
MNGMSRRICREPAQYLLSTTRPLTISPLCYLERKVLLTPQEQEKAVEEQVGSSAGNAIRCSIVFGSLIDPRFKYLNCRICKIWSTARHTISKWGTAGEFPYDDAGIRFAGHNSRTVETAAQELSNSLDVEPAIGAMASVATIVHEKRYNLIPERDLTGGRRRSLRRTRGITPHVCATGDEETGYHHSESRIHRSTHCTLPFCLREPRFTFLWIQISQPDRSRTRFPGYR